MTRKVHAEKTLKENTKEISGFISVVAPCAQVSYRYMSAHLHTHSQRTASEAKEKKPLRLLAQLSYRYIYAHLRGGPGMMRNSGTPCFRALPSITHPRMVTPEPLTDTFRQTHSFRGPRRLREEGLNLPYISHIWPSLTPRIFLIRSPFWNKHSCWRDGASLIAILITAIVEKRFCTQ
jgi:hypothetical protein